MKWNWVQWTECICVTCFLMRTFQCWENVQYELSTQRGLGKSCSLPRRIVYSQSKTENNHMLFVWLTFDLLIYWTDSCFLLASLFKTGLSSGLLNQEILHILLFSCFFELTAWIERWRNTCHMFGNISSLFDCSDVLLWLKMFYPRGETA